MIKSTIDLSQACLPIEEQEEVTNYLLSIEKHLVLEMKYITVNIEVDLQIIDESPFSLDHFMSKNKTNQ